MVDTGGGGGGKAGVGGEPFEGGPVGGVMVEGVVRGWVEEGPRDDVPSNCGVS